MARTQPGRDASPSRDLVATIERFTTQRRAREPTKDRACEPTKDCRRAATRSTLLVDVSNRPAPERSSVDLAGPFVRIF